MKKPKTFEEWVTTFVERLSDYFNLAGWSINITYQEDNAKDGAYAENKLNSPYMHSTLILYPQAKKDFESGEMDKLVMAIVHELTHIFLDPLHDFVLPYLSQTTTPLFADILEQRTQKLTMVFLKNLPKGTIPPR